MKLRRRPRELTDPGVIEVVRLTAQLTAIVGSARAEMKESSRILEQQGTAGCPAAIALLKAALAKVSPIGETHTIPGSLTR